MRLNPASYPLHLCVILLRFFVAHLKFGLNQSDHLFESTPVVSKVSTPVVDASKSLVQTRVPQAMRVYLKAYGKHHGLKMERSEERRVGK